MEHLLLALRMAVPEHSAAFVSGPVASGRRYYLAAGEVDRGKVWRENAADLERFAETVRQRTRRMVICPARFKIEEWRGVHYEAFFREIIDGLAAEVWFLDGWEFSLGAVKEFHFCRSRDIPAYSAEGSLLEWEDGRRLLKSAVEVIAEIRNHAADLEEQLARFPAE